MQDTVKPKITVNEDYLDLRNYNGTSECMSKKTSSKNSPMPKRRSPGRAFSLQNEGIRHEKDPNYSRLIHCGLRNLVTSYNATASSYQKQNLPKRKQCLSENSQTDPRYQRFLVKLTENQSLKSKSDISMMSKKMSLHQVSSSTPAFRNQKPTEKIEPLKNKSTMTKHYDNTINKMVTPRANHIRSRSKDFHIKHTTNCVVNTPYENGLRSIENIKRCVDPRLTEKYSILKVPSWKRSWTIPVFSRKQGLANYNYTDNFDRQTYLFDDGSEVDSMYFDKRPTFLKKVFPKECLVILFVMGAACGILLASLLIYIIFGNELLHAFFKPRESLDPSVKSYVKYIGGGVIYVITRFFRVLGDILSIPIQDTKEPHNPFQWYPDNR